MKSPGSSHAAGSGSAFAEQLRHAIEDSGFTLSEVHRRLTDRGVTVGLATLSQWRSGTRVPQSASSLAIVGALKDVLEVPANTLWDTLSIPLPSGRPVGRSRADELAGAPPALLSALAELDLLGPPELDEVSIQVVLDVGPDRCVSSITTLQVMRANRAGAQRVPAFLVLDSPTAEFPRLDTVSGCTIGRRAERREDGVAVAELILSTPLPRNATAIYEIRTHLAPYPVEDSDFYAHVITGRVTQAVVSARFTPGCLANAGEAFTTDKDGNQISRVGRAVSSGLHNIAHDFGPGQVGIRWWWTDPISPSPSS